MRFVCTQSNLLHGATGVSPLAGRNPQLPILQNTLLEVRDGILHLTCTDLEVGAHVVVAGKAEKDGSCAVPARQFLDFVQQLPGDNPVKLERKQKRLSVTTQGFDAQFPIFEPDDFPLLPQSSTKGHTVTLDGRLLGQALSHTVFAAARDEARPELYSVYLHGDGKVLRVAATDSFRLAEYIVPVESGKFEPVLVPVATANEIVRLFSDVDSVEMTVEKNYMSLESGGYQLSSRLVDGAYPDYRRIIPDSSSTTGTVDQEEFLRALKVVAVFMPRDFRRVEVAVRPLDESLILRVEGGESGQGEVQVAFKGEGHDVDVLLNIQYLLDGVQRMVGDACRLGFSSATDPVVVRPEKETVDYLYIVMPIQA